MKPTQIAINQIPSKQRTSPILAEKMACLLNNVRTRAYELFERRGKYDGYDLDDRFRAEADLGVCNPQASRRPKLKYGYVLSVRSSALTRSKSTPSPRRSQWKGLRSKQTGQRIRRPGL